MISFIAGIFLLIVGYIVYGRIVERVFGVDANRQTPCYAKRDDVDFTPIATWRVYLIEFLNIAGTGPIFGAILGILYGPSAYLWIVFGCIFAGAVHDYLVGMISVRKGGASVPDIVGGEMGRTMYRIMFLFSICLLLLVATVFTETSADLMQTLTCDFAWSSKVLWVGVIMFYFLLATIFPISQIIGRLYPLFGACLLIMAVGVLYGIFFEPGRIPEITDGIYSHHPKGLPVFPMLCVTIACGAISGFHATQAPMMSRCITNERHGRKVFYGAMITEGIVAMIWAAAAIKFAGSYENLAAMGTPATVVHTICSSWLGIAGSILAILGVIVAPVTSGDTAFRSSRLMIAEHYKLGQKSFYKRFYICIPMFALSALLMCVDFSVLWRYFAWCNQTVACIMLWVGHIWLKKNGRNYWIALIPAIFMTVLSISYIILAPEGFDLWNRLSAVRN